MERSGTRIRKEKDQRTSGAKRQKGQGKKKEKKRKRGGNYVAKGSLKGTISVGPWGGPGGDHWSFKASHQGITEIVIHEHVNIKSISFKDANGHISGTFGGRSPNGRGKEKKIAICWPSEYLESISGTYGEYHGLLVIKSLSFITNLTTYGPFGSTSGDDKTFSIPIADSVVVGFHGRAGYYLDALGIFVHPVHSHGTISFGPCGGPGGDEFSFRVLGNWIKEIIVHENTNIKSIAVKDANGKYYGKFGGNDPNDIGVERKIQIDGHLEHLISISGTYGDYCGLEVITSLSFITNLTTHGPFGTARGTCFSIPIQGCLVIGVHGRAGYYLDAIGINVKLRDIEENISIGPWGGPGGNPWSYTANEAINQIIIHVGLNIKSISFRDTCGRFSATFGGDNPHDTGEKQIVHIKWPCEHLISISGTYGNFASLTTITSLSFTTNLATYGPFGTTSGTSFAIPINNNTIIGFHGRAGGYLDSIGILVKHETTI
ncbi:mannose/glucose-specific lectin-like [Neltuma alba]|uniref:mannose/glucose-specific lectin-like n=1 Tax=Neltuma alba TaxID=207710 RepID=UPI0010A44C88|nr:mannose/glucose-specific lectin-like [Prosopis alba]